MRFLIALYNRETARQIVDFSAQIAELFSTDLTVLFVEQDAKRSMSPEMQMVRGKMYEWHMESPGYKVLREARSQLEEMGIVASGEDSGQLRQLIAIAGDHYITMPGIKNEIKKVVFRYRIGDSLEEILDEMSEHHHEILVMGAGKNKTFLEQLMKFSPSSILIVKNPRDIKYNFLVATDGTPPAHRAELLAIKSASVLKRKLTFVSVVKTSAEREFIEKHLDRMTGVARMKGLDPKVLILEGNVVQQITEHAGDDNIIFLGRSRRKAIAKFLFGSKTIKTVGAVNCPLLLVK
jgi:nucleotide-binding universal stress UspA family protein